MSVNNPLIETVTKNKPSTIVLSKRINSNTDLSLFVKAKVLPPSPFAYAHGASPQYYFQDGGKKVKTEQEVIAVIKRNWEGYLANIYKKASTDQFLKPNGFQPSIAKEHEAGIKAQNNFTELNSQYKPIKNKPKLNKSKACIGGRPVAQPMYSKSKSHVGGQRVPITKYPTIKESHIEPETLFCLKFLNEQMAIVDQRYDAKKTTPSNAASATATATADQSSEQLSKPN